MNKMEKRKKILKDAGVLLIATLIVLSTVPATANITNLNKKEENEISNEEAVVGKNILSSCVKANTGLAPTSIKNSLNIKTDSSDNGDNRAPLLTGVTCYGVEIKLLGESWSFDSTTPWMYNFIAPNTHFISGGTWVEAAPPPYDKWYVCEFANPSYIYTINEDDGDIQTVGDTTIQFLEDLAFDDITDTLYGCTRTDLYTIDKNSGTATHVGNFAITNWMVGIAFDISSGTLYGISRIPDALYSIATDTGTATQIALITDTSGPIDLGHFSDIEYDKDNNVLYLAAFLDNNNESHFYKCDKANIPTGVFEYIGPFPYEALSMVSGLAIPYCYGEIIKIGSSRENTVLCCGGEAYEVNHPHPWASSNASILEENCSAHWLWDNSDGDIDFTGECNCFCTKFNLTCDINHACIKYSADDNISMWLNGHRIVGPFNSYKFFWTDLYSKQVPASYFNDPGEQNELITMVCDIYGQVAGGIWCLEVCCKNDTETPSPPDIHGPNSGVVGEEYCWTFSSTDPNCDDVKYIIDWGDGTSTTTDCFPSGQSVEECHTYTEQKTYIITAKAKECTEEGLESLESNFEVVIPRSKAVNNPLFQQFIERILNLFPKLKYLLGIY